jgi:hypothetical protein
MSHLTRQKSDVTARIYNHFMEREEHDIDTPVFAAGLLLAKGKGIWQGVLDIAL